MEIDIETVRRIFDDVLEGRMTREAADRWAYGVVKQAEAGSLTYVPLQERGRIWDAIMYLYGIDTMESPGEYLHSEDDIRSALALKLG